VQPTPRAALAIPIEFDAVVVGVVEEVERLALEVVGAAGESVRVLLRDRVDGCSERFLGVEENRGVE